MNTYQSTKRKKKTISCMQWKPTGSFCGAVFVIAGGTAGCNNGSIRCRQWQRGWHRGSSRVCEWHPNEGILLWLASKPIPLTKGHIDRVWTFHSGANEQVLLFLPYLFVLHMFYILHIIMSMYPTYCDFIRSMYYTKCFVRNYEKGTVINHTSSLHSSGT